MATTLRAESLAELNIRERTVLTEPAKAGDTALTVESSAGITAGMAVCVGTAAQDGAELRIVDAVTSATEITLTAALTRSHAAYEAVTGMVGNNVRIYRAANIDGTAPADSAFSLLSTRALDIDKQSTYYVDSVGSSEYWYKMTYYNDVTLEETDLSSSYASRGDDYGHYASLTEIRSKAGFENATNLKDQRIDLERKAAEAEINTTLAGYYTVPFTKPVPQHIRTMTIQLAAGLLLMSVYGEGNTQGKELVKAARERLNELRTDGWNLADADAIETTSESVSYYPGDDDAHRLFEGVWDKF